MEPTVISGFRRVNHLNRAVSLMGKDAKLYTRALDRDKPAELVCDVSGEVTYGSELTPLGAYEVLFSDGKSLLRCGPQGTCREVLRLEDVRVLGVDTPALEWDINGPIRCSADGKRVYFCLYPRVFGPGLVGSKRVRFCELDVITRQISFFDARFVGSGVTVDGATRAVYLPGEGCSDRDRAQSRDRVVRKSLRGERDRILVAPGCVSHCALSVDGRWLLCSADCGPDRPVSVIDCHGRSVLRFGKWRYRTLPFNGYGAVFGPSNSIFFVREAFSLWRYGAGHSAAERIFEIRTSTAPPSGKLSCENEPACGLGGTEFAREWADVPLVNQASGLVCWRLCIESSGRFLVVVDLRRDEYMVVKDVWSQVAVVEREEEGCVETGIAPSNLREEDVDLPAVAGEANHRNLSERPCGQDPNGGSRRERS